MNSQHILNNSDPSAAAEGDGQKDIYLIPGLLDATLPFGLFYVLLREKKVMMNSRMIDLLDMPKAGSEGYPLSEFTDRVISLADYPEITRVNLTEKINDSRQDLTINLTDRGEGYYKLIFNSSGTETGKDDYWGYLVDQSDDQKNFNFRIRILGELFQKSRKLSAAAGGNLDALSSNVHTWNREVVDDFLFDTRDNIQALNDNLDLVLNYINVINSRSIFPEAVNLREFLEDITSDYPQVELRIMSSGGLDISSISLYLDPELSSLAFSYLIDELASRTLSEQTIDMLVDKKDEMIRIRIQAARTLPLPGLADVEEDSRLMPLNPEVHLADSIFSALGGEVRLEKKPIEQGMGIGIFVSLPMIPAPNDTRSLQSNVNLEKEGRGRILLAESQADYQLSISETLRNLGYRIDLATEGSAALDMVQRINPDVVLTARNLPGMDGVLLTQGIRRWSAVPVIMLSSRAGSDDLAQAFEAGVDDYLKKPFLMEELIFRLQASIRRSLTSTQAIIPDIYNAGDIRINYSTRQVWRKGVPVQLTPIEFNLLVYMSRQGKQIMTYDQLLERVWEGPEKGSRQGLFVHVRRLREKIESDPENPKIITNKWGVGYEYNP